MLTAKPHPRLTVQPQDGFLDCLLSLRLLLLWLPLVGGFIALLPKWRDPRLLFLVFPFSPCPILPHYGFTLAASDVPCGLPRTYRLLSSTRMSHGTLKLGGLWARPHADFPSPGPSSEGESCSHLGGQVANSEAFSVSSRSSPLSSSHAVLPQDRTIYCLTPIRTGCDQNPEITGAGKDVEELEPAGAAGWEREEAQPAWKGRQVLKKLNIDSRDDPAIPLPSTNPGELKSRLLKRCLYVHVRGVLFLAERGRKQPKGP